MPPFPLLRFQVLPVTERQQPTTPASADQPCARQPSVCGCLLLLEDDVGLRATMCDYFSIKGYIVSEAGSGSDFDALFVSHLFDLILLDLNLPDRDGLQSSAICGPTPRPRCSLSRAAQKVTGVNSRARFLLKSGKETRRIAGCGTP